MDSKYYTPTIEEFHVGFEYEYKTEIFLGILENTKDYWKKENFSACGSDNGDSEINDIEKLASVGNVRCKLLDIEDIESLGWKYSKGGGYFVQGYYMLFFDCGFLIIRASGDYHMTEICFNGKVKNKSELQKLITQLGIFK